MAEGLTGRPAPTRRSVLFGGLAAALAWPACAANDRLDPGNATFRDYALSNNATTLLDPTNTVTREWTSNTAQVMPDIVSVDAPAGLARLRLKSVDCEMAVPLGWHAMEDHERAAMFTPDRAVRAIVWRLDLAFEGAADLEKYAAAKQAALRGRNAALTANIRRLAGGEFLAVYSNIPPLRYDTEPRLVFDLMTPNPTNRMRGMLLTLGVPASRADKFLPLLALMARERKIVWREGL